LSDLPIKKDWPVWARAGVLGVLFAGAVALIAGWSFGFLRTSPPTVSYTGTQTSSGTQVNVVMQTVGAIGTGPRPSWVSYLIQRPDGKWVHTTLFSVPAHATVHVKLYEYDSTGILRNPLWATVTGTAGAKEYVTGTVDNKNVTNAPYTVLPADAAAHTFSIPALGVNVPLAGYTGKRTLCGVAPCTVASPHDVDTFTLHTGPAGIFRWQCFMPCGLSFLDGNGGPMQSIGYMMGFMKVVG
jgi:hypothetical protein